MGWVEAKVVRVNLDGTYDVDDGKEGVRARGAPWRTLL